MRFSILLDILLELLSKRMLTAAYLAEKYGISARTVYRYIDILSTAVPVCVRSGRNGGVFISDCYKLPVNFMTEAEYEAAIEALGAMYSQLPEERFLAAKRKLSAQIKTEARELTLAGSSGTILVDSGTWGDTAAFRTSCGWWRNAYGTAPCWKSITTPARASIPTAKRNRTCSCTSRTSGTYTPSAANSAPSAFSGWGE